MGLNHFTAGYFWSKEHHDLVHVFLVIWDHFGNSLHHSGQMLRVLEG
jgi:hypothetical protein